MLNLSWRQFLMHLQIVPREILGKKAEHLHKASMETNNKQTIERNNFIIEYDLRGDLFYATVIHKVSKRIWQIIDGLACAPVMTGCDISAKEIYECWGEKETAFPSLEPKENGDLCVTIHYDLGKKGIVPIPISIVEKSLSVEERNNLIIVDLRNEITEMKVLGRASSFRVIQFNSTSDAGVSATSQANEWLSSTKFRIRKLDVSFCNASDYSNFYYRYVITYEEVVDDSCDWFIERFFCSGTFGKDSVTAFNTWLALPAQNNVIVVTFEVVTLPIGLHGWVIALCKRMK